METEEPCVKEIRKQNNITVMMKEFTDKNCRFTRIIDTKLQEKEFYTLSFSCISSKTGITVENRGYVTIEIFVNFKLKEEFFNYHPYLFICFVSVIDNDGIKRFTKTFPHYYDANSDPELFYPAISEIYISRQSVLNDPHEFLQNDTLTLDVDITFVLQSSLGESRYKKLSELNNLIMSSYYEFPNFSQILSSSTSVKFKLLPDSEVINTLRKVSIHFQHLFAFTKEDTSEFLEFDKQDVTTLTEIFKIVKGVDISPMGVSGIFEFLRVADFYDIPDMLEACRQFIKELLDSKAMSFILRKHDDLLERIKLFATNCKDSTVIELVEGFVESNEQSLEDSGWQDETIEFDLRFKWTYEPSVGFKLTRHSKDFEEDDSCSYSYCN